MTVHWKGNEVKRRIKKATAWGINQVVADTIKHALNNHPNWKYDTGVAEGSITQKDFARPSSLVGRWGSLWSSRAPIGQLVRGRDGKEKRVGVSNYVWYLELYHGPFLRGAADAVYPSLPKRIRNALIAQRFKLWQ